MQKVVLASKKLIHIFPNDQTVYKSFTISRYLQEELKNDPAASVDFLYHLAKSEFPQNVWVQQILNTVSYMLECDSSDLYEFEQLLIVIHTELHDQGHDYLIETIKEIYTQLDPQKNPERSFDFKSVQSTYEKVQNTVKQSNSDVIKSQIEQSLNSNQQVANNSKILEEAPPPQTQAQVPLGQESLDPPQLELSVEKQHEFDYSLITTGRKSSPKNDELGGIIQDVSTPYFPLLSPQPQIEYMPSPPPDNVIETEHRIQDPPTFEQVSMQPEVVNDGKPQWQENEVMNIEEPNQYGYEEEMVNFEPPQQKQLPFHDDPDVIQLRREIELLIMETNSIPRGSYCQLFPDMPVTDPKEGSNKFNEMKNRKKILSQQPQPERQTANNQTTDSAQQISSEKQKQSQIESYPKIDPIIIIDVSTPLVKNQQYNYNVDENDLLQSKPKERQQVVENFIVRQQQAEASRDDILIDQEVELSKKKQIQPQDDIKPQSQKEKVREKEKESLTKLSQSLVQPRNQPNSSPRSQQNLSLNKSGVLDTSFLPTIQEYTPKVQAKNSLERPTNDAMLIEKSQSPFLAPLGPTLQPDCDAFLPLKMTDDIISLFAKRYARLERYLEQYPELNTQILYTKVDNYELYHELGTQKHERIRSGLIKIYQIMEKILLPHQLVKYSFNHDTHNPEPQVIIEFFPKINRKKDKEKSMQIFASSTETFGFLKCELFSIMKLLQSFFLRGSFEKRDSYLFSEVVEVVKRKMLDLVQIQEFRQKFQNEYNQARSEFANQTLI